MTDSHLLSGKFSAAALPAICTPRQHVLKQFHREADKRMIYVSAPAGYGKTVSTQLWLQSSGRVPIWIGLDEYDNSLSVFYKLFCTGILSVQPGNKAIADILKSPAFHSSPVEHTIRILTEFVPDGRQYAVVLDDMHLVSREEIRKSGLLVQKRLPLSFAVVVLTRNVVKEEYLEVTGKEKCSVITALDLAFSLEEIEAYFRACGHVITAEEARNLHTATNGWPIGVTALAKSGQISVEQNYGHALKDYMKEQFWDKWDPSLRDFMLKTSVADEMPVALCERLTGREDSREILESLFTGSSFVSKAANGIYRYHHLFLDFLRGLAEESSLDLRQLNKRAAEYYIEEGEYLKRRRHAVKSGDAETIIRMTHGFVQYTNPSLDEYVAFTRTFNRDALPEYICDRYPFLYSTQIWQNYLCGDARRMEYYMDKMFLFLPVIARDFPQFLEANYLISSIDHRMPFSEQSKWFKSLPPPTYTSDTPQGASLTLQMPFLHRSNRDYFEMRDSQTAELVRRTFGLLLKDARDILIAGVVSGLRMEENRLKEAAEEIALDGIDVETNITPEVVYSIYLHRSAVQFAMGNEKEAAGFLQTAEKYIAESGATYLRPNFIAYKTRVMLMDGDKSAAKAWLEHYFVTITENLELYKIYQHFTTARAYMALGDTDMAMRYISRLKKLGADFIRPLDIAEATVLQAALEWAVGDKKEALGTLEEALTAMQKYGFIRVIADEGAAVLPILKKLELKLKKENAQSALNARYLNEVIIVAYEVSKRHKGVSANIRPRKPIKLSKQQKHIISLLSKGYKHAEIVELTGLTIHTVKSHCAAAYAKLDANNAMDAVVKAKELGLID